MLEQFAGDDHGSLVLSPRGDLQKEPQDRSLLLARGQACGGDEQGREVRVREGWMGDLALLCCCVCSCHHAQTDLLIDNINQHQSTDPLVRAQTDLLINSINQQIRLGFRVDSINQQIRL